MLAACSDSDPQTTPAGAVPETAPVTLPPIARLTQATSLPFTTARATPIYNGVVVQLDADKPGVDISPYIYGLAGSDAQDPNYAARLHTPLFRWGGNPSTRYNWVQGNAWNNGRDFEFRNTSYANTGDAATAAISGTLQANSTMLLTIPTIGWVAKNSDQNTRSMGVPDHGGSPLAIGSSLIVGYDPGPNRALTSVPSYARKKAAFVTYPDPQSPAVYQDEWVASLVQRFGPASKGGVKFYAMDNEPDLWSETHTDVHPARMGYDDMLAQFTDYASAVKDVDPSAQITGPVVWGWTSYLWSELDRGNDNFKTAADRQAHHNLPFIAWFLDQLKQYETKNGKRLLDVLDIHYYPQANGVYQGKTDPDSNALRLRSTQSLWVSRYTDESWINQPINLIPRMRDWINSYYPGTKLGISEWNFGADNTLNGGLTISTVLGLFGREGVYLANYWRYPPAESPGFYAFKMYTNYDDKGSTFGDKSLPVKVSNEQKISCFAALDSKSGKLNIILINNQPDQSQAVRIDLAKPVPGQLASLYQISTVTGNKLAARPGLSISAATNNFEIVLPAYSSTLVSLQL